MSCINCDSYFDEVSGLRYQNCNHVVCLVCLQELVEITTANTLECPEIDCEGFIESHEFKWAVAPEVFKEYLRRLDITSYDVPMPSTSKSVNPKKLIVSESDTYTAEILTLEELELTEEELSSGWGQMATYINNLMKNDGVSFADATNRVDSIPLWVTRVPISCPICLLDDIPPHEGIILKDCFHTFCRACMSRHIEISTDAEVKCPYNDGEYSCSAHLKPRELRSLVTKETYEKHYEEFSLKEAQAVLGNVFHCKTPDCQGFCTYDEENGTIFVCPICEARNCISCKVLHEGSCAEYWQQIEDERNHLLRLEQEAREKKRQLQDNEANRLLQSRNEQLSESLIHGQLSQRVFMRCPRCNIPCYKTTGCAHMVCALCKHSFNWSGVQGSFH